MIPERLLLHKLTALVGAVDVDGYGNETKDYSAATATPVDGRIQQNQRQVTHDDGRTTTVDEWLLFTNDRIDGVGRIVWPAEGKTFDVDGAPEPVYDGGAYHHTEATLRRVAG